MQRIKEKLKNKKYLIKPILISLVVIAVCLVVGMFLSKNNTQQIPSTVVEVETIKSAEVENSEVYQGTLISRYSVSLQPQVTGQIASINVKAGDRVRAGQILLVIDPRKQEATLNSSKADAASMKAAIEQARSNLNTYEVQKNSLISNYEIAKTQYERYRDLYERKTVSKQDLENYTDAYRKAKSALDSNTAQIKAQKSAVNAAVSNYKKSTFTIKEQGVQLAYHKIVAPYAGIIGDIPVKIGEYVTSDTKLLSITQNNQLELNVGLPSEKVFIIQKGLPVQILDYDGKAIADSKLSFVSPRIDTDTQTILVKAIFKNPKEMLKADQSVKARVLYSKSQGILIPTSAVTHLGGQDFAFVVNENEGQKTVKQVPITVGEIQNEKYVIKKGLNIGDCIVTQGVQKLYDGAVVTTGKEEKK
jgi:RND family efflux transporter MFP subunit